MLAKILEHYKVVNSVGEELGKVKEAYVDLEKWTVVAFEVSHGMLKKNYLLKVEEILKMDTEDQHILVKDEHEMVDVPKIPTKTMFPLDELKKLPVLDKNGDKIGKLYNLEVPYEKLKSFKVWKVLIRTGFKDRRLRISPTEISEVMKDIRLKKAESEYSGEKEE